MARKKQIVAPKGLGKFAAKWWVANIPIIEANSKEPLTEAELMDLETLATLYELVKIAEQHLIEESPVAEYSNGNVGLNKWEVVYNKKIKLYYDLARDYGLTPLSKSKLEKTQNKVEEGDGLDSSEKELKDLVKQFG